MALPNTTEAAEMIQIRDLVVAELRSRGLSVLTVPRLISVLSKPRTGLMPAADQKMLL